MSCEYAENRIYSECRFWGNGEKWKLIKLFEKKV